ncbi:hypothetical protein FIV42_07590 [Persicimonas caeni]|uniref:TerB family tellurite resistance protein n=1 Tax=Persicimonas caeni TaxID=2292766 RepID=A0A4Y6PQK5_PERCE|nr:hypothetical protein [Persicimonas caeni]QDG50598.1 hypothetical protein FIV42_07590 [Persicimonas caeni]QED31819.1 hypothetical protein FRD00_07585 [Persicimonas caeni]
MTAETTEEYAGADRALRDLAVGLRRELRGADLRSGRWFYRVLASYVKWHEERRQSMATRESSELIRQRLARRTITQTCVQVALSGAAAGALVTEATIVTTESQGMLGIVAIPVAGLTVAADMIMRTLLQLRLTCDLANLYGVDVTTAELTELMQLCALSYRTYEDDGDASTQTAMIERIAHVEADTTSRAIGTRLTSESVVRNVVPFFSVVTSATSSWRLTRQMGEFLVRYLYWREALDEACAQVEAEDRAAVDLLIEGFWHIFSADGVLDRAEVAILARLLGTHAVDPTTLSKGFSSDEAGWLEQLARLDDAQVALRILEGLQRSRCVDRQPTAAEQRVVEHAAEALGLN